VSKGWTVPELYPGEREIFRPLQTSTTAHPAFCTIRPACLPGVKRPKLASSSGLNGFVLYLRLHSVHAYARFGATFPIFTHLQLCNHVCTYTSMHPITTLYKTPLMSRPFYKSNVHIRFVDSLLCLAWCRVCLLYLAWCRVCWLCLARCQVCLLCLAWCQVCLLCLTRAGFVCCV
jgi:hypothetical protein